MNASYLRQELPINGLGAPFYFFATIGSTNDHARELAENGAPHGTLVVADEQTAGRGRSGKSWFTPAGSAIAMSFVLRGLPSGQEALGGLNVLGSLALIKTLEHYRKKVEMKWPNDVLLEGKKVSGILVEPIWSGVELEAVVVGIGVNVTKGAVPSDDLIEFPATSLEGSLMQPVRVERLVVEIVANLARLLHGHDLARMAELCEPYLAYRGRQVRVETQGMQADARVLGLQPDGRLSVLLAQGKRIDLRLEEATIRPIDSE